MNKGLMEARSPRFDRAAVAPANNHAGDVEAGAGFRAAFARRKQGARGFDETQEHCQSAAVGAVALRRRCGRAFKPVAVYCRNVDCRNFVDDFVDDFFMSPGSMKRRCAVSGLKHWERHDSETCPKPAILVLEAGALKSFEQLILLRRVFLKPSETLPTDPPVAPPPEPP